MPIEQFAIGEVITCFFQKPWSGPITIGCRGNPELPYEAKIVDTKITDNVLYYKIHYQGYNKRFDEWIQEGSQRLVKIASNKKAVVTTPVVVKKSKLTKRKNPPKDQTKEKRIKVESEESETPKHNLYDGEYQLSREDALYLTTNVFGNPSEKISKTFKVLHRFHSDCMKLHYFVITDRNVYVCEYRHKTLNGSEGNSSNVSLEGFFIPVVRIPLERIKAIKIAVDHLSFMLESNEDGFIYFTENVEKDDKMVFTYTAALASMECGYSFMHPLFYAISASGNRFLVSERAYRTLLKQSLETKLSRTIDIGPTALCFWYGQTYDEREQSMTTKTGYLFKTRVGTWMNGSEEADRKYCVIVGNCLHVFHDSNSKSVEFVINLSTSTLHYMGSATFQLEGPEGHFEFESSSQEDYAEWMAVLGQIMENKAPPQNMTPCLTVLLEGSIVVVQEGENFWADGFLRLLNEIPRDSFQQLIVVHQSKYKGSIFENCAPALCLVTSDKSIQYFFPRFIKELDRFMMSVEVTFRVRHRKLDEQMMQTPIGKTIHNTCCLAKSLWPN